MIAYLCNQSAIALWTTHDHGFQQTKAILERYMAKFSKGGKMDLADDFGLAPAPVPE